VPDAHREVAASMLRVFAPQLPLYGVGIVLTGVLQAHHRFAWPVIAPLLSSVTVMGAYLTYAVVDGRRTDFGGLSSTGERVLSAGTTLGVVVLALCLLIPLRRLRLRLRPAFGFPGGEGRQAVRLGWAGAVTVGAQQVMLAVAIALAVGGAGDLVAFNAAQTIFLVPWAVLAVPLATAVYPTLSAADVAGYRAALAPAARSVVLLAGLGTAALAALATPIAGLVGAPAAAAGIAGFAAGLFGYALFALLSRALYARGWTVAAAAGTAAGWGVAAAAAVVLSATLGDDRQVLALGLANALGMSVIGVLLVLAVRRHAGAEALAGLGRAATTGIVAAVVAAFAGWATAGALGRVAGLFAGGVVVLVAYAAVALALDAPDVRRLVDLIRRRSRKEET
jgi:putative peptidoglycan lipid II flippase